MREWLRCSPMLERRTYGIFKYCNLQLLNCLEQIRVCSNCWTSSSLIYSFQMFAPYNFLQFYLNYIVVRIAIVKSIVRNDEISFVRYDEISYGCSWVLAVDVNYVPMFCRLNRRSKPPQMFFFSIPNLLWCAVVREFARLISGCILWRYIWHLVTSAVSNCCMFIAIIFNVFPKHVSTWSCHNVFFGCLWLISPRMHR
jgi:hypothetical protein